MIRRMKDQSAPPAGRTSSLPSLHTSEFTELCHPSHLPGLRLSVSPPVQLSVSLSVGKDQICYRSFPHCSPAPELWHGLAPRSVLDLLHSGRSSVCVQHHPDCALLQTEAG
ncbi:hypothetical protein AAFF_G00360820 [Aldrovandia affinis]|uniref:Uncharacterized protein n=1 Tax=Aldrovandia affinis TaxID=143900 RepID=A0AAD7R7F9_9TELE|nr:hypothetical protein AAFF_G00360820 [Aldrovandia affinis]